MDMEHPVLKVFDTAAALVAAKASDYAENDDVFSNFKNVAGTVGITVDQVFFSQVVNKVERIRQLLAKGSAENEPLEDSLLDLGNYAFLWKAYLDGGAQ